VELHPIVRQPFPQLLQKPLRFLPVLKPEHKVVRVTDDNHIAAGELPAPLPDPLIEGVMQIDIRK